jgi:hypothetical protein
MPFVMRHPKSTSKLKQVPPAIADYIFATYLR